MSDVKRTHGNHKNVSFSHSSLSDMGIQRPKNWAAWNEGERMDWLNDLIWAAHREYRRYDAMIREEHRENSERFGRK